MTTYLGFDVLEVEPNRSGDLDDVYERRVVILDPETTDPWIDEVQEGVAPVRTVVWTAFSRAEATAIRSFLDARRGICVPFWLPSWQQDLTLANPVVSPETGVDIVAVSYSGLMFPRGNARRHLAVLDVTQAPSYYGIEDASDAGDGLVENLTLAAPAARNWPVASTILSFLKLCRLEGDHQEIEWSSIAVAECRLRVREIPNEAPSP